MKQFVLFFISLFLLGVGARSQEMYQKKVFISSRGDSLNYLWGIERSGFFNGREKWVKGFENQMV